MKKILIIFILIIIPKISMGSEKTTNFDLKKLFEIQKSGKTIVINSWNKYCSTCAAQTKVFDQAMKDFKDVEFLFYEQDKNKDIAKTLGINYWTTIVVFKGQNEVGREMGLTDKDQIYNLINKGI
jgi:thiol-disulfide isomerase/thioredoxin|tara:strand:- start:8 stop:382 length:375 start_codon:yes stop_codon:yes gene_type:complete